MIETTELAIAGERWRRDELAALIQAVRELLRSSRIDGRLRDADDPLRITVPGPELWALGEAIDRPYGRREADDPALLGAAAD